MLCNHRLSQGAAGGCHVRQWGLSSRQWSRRHLWWSIVYGQPRWLSGWALRSAARHQAPAGPGARIQRREHWLLRLVAGPLASWWELLQWQLFAFGLLRAWCLSHRPAYHSPVGRCSCLRWTSVRWLTGMPHPVPRLLALTSAHKRCSLWCYQRRELALTARLPSFTCSSLGSNLWDLGDRISQFQHRGRRIFQQAKW